MAINYGKGKNDLDYDLNLNTSLFSPEGDGHEEGEDQEPAARQDWILWHHHFRGTLRLLASGLRPEGGITQLWCDILQTFFTGSLIHNIFQIIFSLYIDKKIFATFTDNSIKKLCKSQNMLWLTTITN